MRIDRAGAQEQFRGRGRQWHKGGWLENGDNSGSYCPHFRTLLAVNSTAMDGRDHLDVLFNHPRSRTGLTERPEVAGWRHTEVRMVSSDEGKPCSDDKFPTFSVTPQIQFGKPTRPLGRSLSKKQNPTYGMATGDRTAEFR